MEQALFTFLLLPSAYSPKYHSLLASLSLNIMNVQYVCFRIDEPSQEAEPAHDALSRDDAMKLFYSDYF